MLLWAFHLLLLMVDWSLTALAPSVVRPAPRAERESAAPAALARPRSTRFALVIGFWANLMSWALTLPWVVTAFLKWVLYPILNLRIDPNPRGLMLVGIMKLICKAHFIELLQLVRGGTNVESEPCS